MRKKIILAVCVGAALIGSSAIPTHVASAPKDDVPVNFDGYVSGIDVFATPEKPIYCLAFISKERDTPPGLDEIQVTTRHHRVQTVLESASARAVRVEASYLERDGTKELIRVRILDREERQRPKAKE